MTTPFLLQELQAEEGLRLTAYQDTRGVWTIGYGHTGPDVVEGLRWTLATAEAWLIRDVSDTVERLEAALPWFKTLDDVRQDVLVDMAFNLGVEGLLGFKVTLADVEAGNYHAASGAMLLSHWAAQIGERAERLAMMMKTGERS